MASIDCISDSVKDRVSGHLHELTRVHNRALDREVGWLKGWEIDVFSRATYTQRDGTPCVTAANSIPQYPLPVDSILGHMRVHDLRNSKK